MTSSGAFKISVVLIGLLFLFMLRGPIYFFWITPLSSFDEKNVPAALDYKGDSSWAEKPNKLDPSKVPTFYIHPTSLRSRFAWNSTPGTIESAKKFEWARQWQIPSFAYCCDVFAPYYRQATLAAYWRSDSGRKARDLAYSDVLRAFDQFVSEVLPNQKGFILAGHSQGSEHGLRLLRERVLGTPLEKQMIVAILPGIPVPAKLFKETHGDFPLCGTPTQTSCLMVWSTFKDGVKTEGYFTKGDWHFPDRGYELTPAKEFHCVNPLSWTRSDEVASSDLHLGATLENGVAKTGAQCTAQGLIVDDIDSSVGYPMGGNYHLYDYSLFTANIRQNLALRVQKFLEEVAD